MKILKKLALVGMVVVSLLTFNQAVFAQQPEALTPFECSDLYKFGSVKVDINPETTATLAGAKARFFLKITNENDYPIVDGSVYVKIFEKQSSADNSQKNGGFLVDQFFAKEGLPLKAKESKSLDFLWTVPAWLPAGDYYAFTYFQSAKKMNLQGLTFTDDIAGGRTDFVVKSQFKNSVGFDRNNVKLNDKNYIFINPPARVSKDQEVTIKIPVQNPTSEKQSAVITYELYFWDGLTSSQKIETKQDTVELNPRETKYTSYVTNNNQYPVYYLVAKSKWKDVSSILDMRFVREGINRGRVNFQGVTKFPVRGGEANTIFACVHNTAPDDQSSLYETTTYSNGAKGEGDAIVESKINGKLELSLLDKDGEVVKKYAYTGSITGEIMGFKADLVPDKNYDNFRVKASLFDDQSKLMDEVVLKYNCGDIDQTKCSVTAATNGTESPTQQGGRKVNLVYAYIVAGLLVIIVIAVIVIKKRKSATGDYVDPNNFPGGPTTGTTTMALLITFLVTALIFGFSGTKTAEAKSTQFTYLYKGILKVFYNSTLFNAMKDPYYAITYKATAISSTGAVLNDGDVVPVGPASKVTFSYSPNDFKLTGSDTAYWVGTGDTYDTPYGHWKAGGAYPYSSTLTCSNYDNFLSINGLNLYRPFSVNPPSVAIDTSEAEGAGILGGCTNTAYSRTCTVNASGTFSVSVKFDQTYAYQYSNIDGGQIGCAYRGRLKVDASTDFKLTIPEQVVMFQLKAGSATAPVATLDPPIINGANMGHTGVIYTFSALSNSAGIDNIKYGFDWNGDAVVDTWTPYVNKITAGTATRSWPTIGSKTFRVRAQDQATALLSDWGTHTIYISGVPAGVSLDSPIVTGPSSGRVNVSYTFVAHSSSTGINNIKYGFDWNNDGTEDTWTPLVNYQSPASVTNSWPTAGMKTFQVRAWGEGGTPSSDWTRYSINITTTGLDAPIITGPTSGRTGVNYTFSAISSSTGTNGLRYCFNWNNDGTTCSWTPLASYLTPGTNSFTWASNGPQTFQVKAQDSDLAESPWTPFIINIQDNASCTVAEFWTPCSATCGGGTQDRVKLTSTCSVETLETRACNTRSCGTVIIEVPPGSVGP